MRFFKFRSKPKRRAVATIDLLAHKIKAIIVDKDGNKLVEREWDQEEILGNSSRSALQSKASLFLRTWAKEMGSSKVYITQKAERID